MGEDLSDLGEVVGTAVLRQAGDYTAGLVGRPVVRSGEPSVGAGGEERWLVLVGENDERSLIVRRQEVADPPALGWAETCEARLLLITDAEADVLTPDRSFVGAGKREDDLSDVVLGDGRQCRPVVSALAMHRHGALRCHGRPRRFDRGAQVVASDRAQDDRLLATDERRVVALVDSQKLFASHVVPVALRLDARQRLGYGPGERCGRSRAVLGLAGRAPLTLAHVLHLP